MDRERDLEIKGAWIVIDKEVFKSIIYNFFVPIEDLLVFYINNNIESLKMFSSAIY